MILKRYILAHQQARDGCSRFAQDAPAGTVVKFEEPRRDSAINAALHAKFGEIAGAREWAGRKWDIETWKRLLVAAWSRAIGDPVVMLPALDGAGIDLVFRRTSQMTQKEVSDLLAFVESWHSETEL